MSPENNVFFIWYTVKCDRWSLEKIAEFDTEHEMMEFLDNLSNDANVKKVRTSSHFDPWKWYYRGEE